MNDHEDHGYTRKSRSQLKREATALQKLGERLVALTEGALKRLAIPDELKDAVREARGITSHEARRRQEQFIGSLMRDLDVAVIEGAIQELDAKASRTSAAFHRLETMRDSLADGDEALFSELMQEAGDERQRFGQLVRNAKKERTTGKPKGAGKALFRFLQDRFVA